jgi:hypothetical protein
MPNIHGALLKAPKPPPRGKFKEAGDKIRANKGYQRAQRRFQTATGNVTSKPAWRAAKGGKTKIPNKKFGRFGRTTPNDREVRTDQRLASANAAVKAGTFGLAVGGVAGGNVSGRQQQIQRNKQSINRNKKKLGEVGKRVHLITDVGTSYARTAEKVGYGTRPWKAGLAAAGVGAGTTGALTVKVGRQQKKELKQQKGVLVEQRSKLKQARSQVTKSAFGVEH